MISKLDNKYEQKSREIMSAWGLPPTLQRQIADSLTEAVREAMERAIKISLGVHERCLNSDWGVLCGNIIDCRCARQTAEAIRKEMP